MKNDELKTFFDQLAPNYDKQMLRMAPMNNNLYFLLESVFSEVPEKARVLCVGAGTGQEIIFLAKKFPGWSFTAVDPSGVMLAGCHHHIEAAGFASRCRFHEGFINSLPTSELYDAATCFLVSHFITEQAARSDFFRQIASRLQPDGILASSDLCYDTDLESYDAILPIWQKIMTSSNADPKLVARMKDSYANDVGVLPPSVVASIIKSGGFKTPVPFFQAGLIHGWFSKRA